MKSNLYRTILIIILLGTFLITNCTTTSIILGLYEITQRTDVIDMVKDTIIKAAKEIFMFEEENIETEVRVDLEDKEYKVEHKHPSFSTIIETDPYFIWTDIEGAKYEIYLYEKVNGEYELLQNLPVSQGTVSQVTMLTTDEQNWKIVEKTKSRYVLPFPFFFYIEDNLNNYSDSKKLERGKEYAWEVIIKNPEEVAIEYEELPFVNEELKEEVGRVEEMIPFKVATEDEINTIQSNFQEFKNYVDQQYDERQIEEQDKIGLFDFQMAVLSYKHNLLYEAEKYIIKALLKINNYILSKDMVADTQASEQNIILNEYQYIVIAQAIYADLSLSYEFNQLRPKRIYLSQSIEEYPYNLDEYIAGRR